MGSDLLIKPNVHLGFIFGALSHFDLYMCIYCSYRFQSIIKPTFLYVLTKSDLGVCVLFS